jgi:uncharacterized protein (DUF302 family)
LAPVQNISTFFVTKLNLPGSLLLKLDTLRSASISHVSGSIIYYFRQKREGRRVLMKKTIIGGVAGFVLGIGLTVGVIMAMAPGMMIFEDVSPYSFEETVTKLEASTKKQGWSIPAVHDLQKSMKKFGKDVRPVKVFELCHPDHAGKILAADSERIVSSLMPCRVAVYERADGKTHISRMNSGMMAGMFGGLIAEVMADAAAENEQILKPIIGSK